jgi:hypothetical protein
MGDYVYQQCSGVRCRVSGVSPAAGHGATSLIEKETKLFPRPRSEKGTPSGQFESRDLSGEALKYR